MKERINAANEQIGAAYQGWFVWHHTLLSFPESAAFDRECNATDRARKNVPRSEPRIDMNGHVEHPDHPITAGVSDFDLSGERFALPPCAAHSTVLLTHATTFHLWCGAASSAARACLRLQSGHDATKWTNPNFRTIFQHGIECSARHR